MIHQDRGGCTVEDFCNHVHRTLVKDMKYALVWGTSARHNPQNCGLSQHLEDEDVVQIVKKKVHKIIIFPSMDYDLCSVMRLAELILLILKSLGERRRRKRPVQVTLKCPC